LTASPARLEMDPVVVEPSAESCRYLLISNDIIESMSIERTPLYVRLPRNQSAALDRLAQATGRPKQHLVSELLGDRLTTGDRQLSVGRVEVSGGSEIRAEEVLTLEEVAALLKVSPEAVRSHAEEGALPGRRFGKDWRFARVAVLAWLAEGEPQRRKRKSQT
jgi:excisionase family DNA binding protein